MVCSVTLVTLLGTLAGANAVIAPIVIPLVAAVGITLQADEDAVEELAREGYDPKYGARPLRRCLQEKLEDAVAEQLLDGTLHSGDTARLTLEGDRLLVTK